jgi:medium-chain acyl-[acyl-carrier-protein] hydrolase
LQPPGRETRIAEPPLTSVAALAEWAAAEIERTAGEQFALFGYSFGSLVAFETARLLRRRGLMPSNLTVAALRAPQIPHRGRRIHEMPVGEFTGELRRLKGTPEAILGNAELMSLVLPAIRADFQAYETYRYREQEPLECPISVMGGIADPSASQAELVAWSEQTSATFRLRMMPGDHFFIHSARSLIVWAILQDLLEPLRVAC